MMVTCVSCDEPIKDKFLMRLNGRPWHPSCLQCSACKSALSETCFQRDGRLYCKSDFFKIFGTKCAGCGLAISPHELVRKSRSDRIYHVPCFVCSVCRKEVVTGEELFVLENDKVLCKEDFFSQGRQRAQRSTKKPLKDSMVDQVAVNVSSVRLTATAVLSFEKQEFCRSRDGDDGESQCRPSVLSVPDRPAHSDDEELCDTFEASRETDIFKNEIFLARRRSEKSFHDGAAIEDMEHSDNDDSLAESTTSSTNSSINNNINNNNKETTIVRNDPDDKMCTESFASENPAIVCNRKMFSSSSSSGQMGISLANNNNNNNNNGGSSSNLSSGAGAKRRGPRTTIKAKQLETLKAAFSATPKPTRHIREQLARDTGLNMRVIQVWFQNRRSKERRMKQMSVFGPVRRHQFLRSPRRVRSMLVSSSSQHSSEREVVIGAGKMFYENQNCDPDFFRGGFYSQYRMSPRHNNEIFVADCQLIPPSMPMDTSDLLNGLPQGTGSSDEHFRQCFQHCH